MSLFGESSNELDELDGVKRLSNIHSQTGGGDDEFLNPNDEAGGSVCAHDDLNLNPNDEAGGNVAAHDDFNPNDESGRHVAAYDDLNPNDESGGNVVAHDDLKPKDEAGGSVAAHADVSANVSPVEDAHICEIEEMTTLVPILQRSRRWKVSAG
jgi:hypothetical protein